MKSNTLNKKSKPNKYSNSYKMSFYHLPIIFIISILPFIMHFHYYNPKLSNNPWFGDISQATDVFLYYKQLFFIIATSIMILGLIYNSYTKHWKISITKQLFPLLVYGILAILSTVFSKHPSFGFTGVYEQFESIFALLSYVIVIYYIYIFINSEEDLKIINKYLLYSILLFSLLGFSQAIGHDFLRTDVGKKLYVPIANWNTLSGIEFNFPAKTAYLTLYNPNYAGVYTAFVIPILTGLIITMKDIKSRIVLGIAILGMLITLVSSGSAAGMISIIISLFVIIVLFRKLIFKNKKISIGILLVCSILIIAVFATKFNTIKTIIDNKLSTTKTQHDLSAIETGKELKITYKGNTLIANYTFQDPDTEITLTDSNNATIALNPQNSSGQITINDERFKDIIIIPAKYNNIVCLDFKINDKDWVFTNQTGDNTFYFINPVGQFDKLKTADSALFTGYENLASGRGYIWSRSIPLLKKYIILGAGADNFIFTFPHDDYLNSFYAGFEGQILSKPHSLYLQIGIQTGVLSLFAFLLFYLLYFISSLRLYIKCNFNTYWQKAGASYFVGTISYMIAGIANDSTITIAPVFWAILGLGVTINYKLSKTLKEK